MTTSNQLSCQELVELVTEYLEEALPPTERVRFEAHLATCAGCRTFLEQMRRTIRALGKLTEDSIPEKSKEELLRDFRNWKRK